MSSSFFDCLDHDTAMDVENLSRAIYELRESRKRVLAEAGCEDTAQMLSHIQAGKLANHPGYEWYLAARVMEQAREDVRMALRPQPGERPAHCLHPALAEHVRQTLGPALATTPEIMQDALRLTLRNGMVVTARFASDSEWSVEWQQGEKLAGISTAPVANALTSHHGDETLSATVSAPRTSAPAENVLTHILNALLAPLDSHTQA